MRVLVVGSGGREHALVRHIARSPLVDHLFVAPGRGGFAGDATVVSIADLSVPSLLEAADNLDIDLTVVGPEAPLVDGIVDQFQAAGRHIFGPDRDGAQLEGSKRFAKEILGESGVATATYADVTTMEEARAAIRKIGVPAAVKADGLAAGKGVVIVRTAGEALDTMERFLGGDELGEAGSRIVYEEFMEGEELSLIAIASGGEYALFPTARDYKRIGEGGMGANTGGMGSISPVPGFGADVAQEMADGIIAPVLHQMALRGSPYSGFLYAGIMLTAGGPKVLEFNCRLGDPEAQAIIPLIAEDLVPRMVAVAKGKWVDAPIAVREESAVCLVLAAGGYPAAPITGAVIRGLDADTPEWSEVCHAGTTQQDDQFVTGGGRVLNVVARGKDIEEARSRAYDVAGQITFEGRQLRGDIGIPGVRG